MTYDLYLGDPSYSSWSLRAWLLFDRWEIPFTPHWVDFAAEASVAQQLAPLGPVRTVPTLVIDGALAVGDSLAIAEELASRHPEKGLWPANPKDRAIARTLVAEMHSGFMALRAEHPMNLGTAYTDVVPGPAVQSDLERIGEIWGWAKSQTATEGPWLLGQYSVADAFYAPVAGRIAGYGLPVDDDAATYVNRHLADPAFRRWRDLGLARNVTLPWYAKDFRQVPWPDPLG